MSSGWNSLQGNQTVSFNNLQDAVNKGIFFPVRSIPASNEQITKADADFYVLLNNVYPPYANKANNQLVVKSDIALPNSAVIRFVGFVDGNFTPLIGYETSGQSCSVGAGATEAATVYYSGTLGNGTVLYITPSAVFAAASDGGWFFIDGNTFQMQFNSSKGLFEIINWTPCVTGVAFFAKYSNDFSSVCISSIETVYTSGGFTTGVTVYTDIGLTIPLTGYDYISETSNGTIWNINSGNGVIGTSTGIVC